jgi:hypothetical protein
MTQEDRLPWSKQSQQLDAEFRRVRVSHHDLLALVRVRREEYFKEHPDIAAQVRSAPGYDPESTSLAYDCGVALAALASLPDGAGAAAFLARLGEVAKKRQGGSFGRYRGPDA